MLKLFIDPGPFLPITRVLYSAPFPIQNIHLFSKFPPKNSQFEAKKIGVFHTIWSFLYVEITTRRLDDDAIEIETSEIVQRQKIWSYKSIKSRTAGYITTPVKMVTFVWYNSLIYIWINHAHVKRCFFYCLTLLKNSQNAAYFSQFKPGAFSQNSWKRPCDLVLWKNTYLFLILWRYFRFVLFCSVWVRRI